MDRFQQAMAGDPVCGHCKYSLKGLTDTPRCPECGKPIVDTLIRTGFAGFNGKRYRSAATFLGLPLVSISSGATAEEKFGHARGFIAIGDVATGVLAIGAVARGVIAIGSLAMGAVAIGGTAVGFLAMGGIAVGFGALGGVSAGFYALGGAVFFIEQGLGGARIRLPWFW
jgi:hypothetical protein